MSAGNRDVLDPMSAANCWKVSSKAASGMLLTKPIRIGRWGPSLSARGRSLRYSLPVVSSLVTVPAITSAHLWVLGPQEGARL